MILGFVPHLKKNIENIVRYNYIKYWNVQKQSGQLHSQESRLVTYFVCQFVSFF